MSLKVTRNTRVHDRPPVHDGSGCSGLGWPHPTSVLPSIVLPLASSVVLFCYIIADFFLRLSDPCPFKYLRHVPLQKCLSSPARLFITYEHYMSIYDFRDVLNFTLCPVISSDAHARGQSGCDRTVLGGFLRFILEPGQQEQVAICF